MLNGTDKRLLIANNKAGKEVFDMLRYHLNKGEVSNNPKLLCN